MNPNHLRGYCPGSYLGDISPYGAAALSFNMRVNDTLALIDEGSTLKYIIKIFWGDKKCHPDIPEQIRLHIQADNLARYLRHSNNQLPG